MKNHVVGWLEKNGYEVVNFGTDSTDSTDYPIYAEKVAKAVVSGECDRGILICGTGIGMSIAANKIPGIRAAVCSDCYSAEATRLHNDANILCLGARVIGEGLALRVTDAFLDMPFSEEERHIRRIKQLEG
jgi:ribose 5-phosphate isomerase B